MPLTLLADRQYTAPSAAASVSITPNASAWANSAYVELLAATPAACVLTGVTLYTADISANVDVEVDIATGAAAAEVVIATVRAYIRFNGAANQSGPSCCCVLPIPIDNIGSGVRLAARLRKGDTDVANAWRVAILYLQKPLVSAILTTATVQQALPPAAAGVTLTAGSPAWVNGAWAQLRSAAGASLVIVGVVAGSPSVNAVNYELDLGTGAAAAETVITTVALHLGQQGLPCWLLLPTPLDNVAASTRLAARLRCSTASTTLTVSLMVLEQPL